MKTGVQSSIKKSTENRNPTLVIVGSIWGTIFESKVGRLPVEDESDMWTPNSSHFETLGAPKKVSFLKPPTLLKCSK